jgi:hypothetical protein
VVDKSAFSDDAQMSSEIIALENNSPVESIHTIFGAAEIIGT